MKTKKKRGFDYKLFKLGFYLYLALLNVIWFIACLFIAIFTLKWRYDMARFSGYVFELHFRKAMLKKLEKKSMEILKTQNNHENKT